MKLVFPLCSTEYYLRDVFYKIIVLELIWDVAVG